MAKHAKARVREAFSFPFHSVRNITSPEDQTENRKVHVGHAPLSSILDLPTNENVRDYLLEAEGKQRRRPTQVHRAIRDTLENNTQNFSVLNGGITVVARSCDIDEQKKTLLLYNPSIINGSQTQGVIKDLASSLENESLEELMGTSIKYEIIVTDSDDLIAEISIARNFQNDVMSISIAGRLGQLDELEEHFRKKSPEAMMLQKSETKLSDDYIKTERLLQVITALIPEELWMRSADFNKTYTYSMKARCLKDFQDIYVKAQNTSAENHEEYASLYRFFLDISAEAWQLYKKWKTHEGFIGTRIRSIEREDGGVVEVPDGIIFPILASLSAFAVKTKTGWTIKYPSSFNDGELIMSAKSAYQEIAGSNPNVMGKSKACYSALYQITSIFKKLSQDR